MHSAMDYSDNKQVINTYTPVIKLGFRHRLKSQKNSRMNGTNLDQLTLLTHRLHIFFN